MQIAFLSKSTLVIGLGATLLSSVGYAADLGDVRVTFDPSVAERTNMQRPPGDSSTLGVTYDQDLHNRTNMMPRDPHEASTVKSQPDKAVQERTNMGGTALKRPPEPASTTAATPTPTPR
jgi:hypothetical protein